MALKQRTATGQYVKIKNGKLYLSSDKELANPFEEIEGTLVDVYLKDDQYEGTPQRKLYLVLNDGDTNYILSLTFESRYASTFLNFLPNVDLKKPITLSPSSKTTTDASGKEKTSLTMFVKQNGVSAKSYHTNDKPNGLPPMKKVRVSGKDIWDKTDVLEFYENYIQNELRPSLSATPAAKATRIIQTDESVPFPDLVQEEDNDFPWEK